MADHTDLEAAPREFDLPAPNLPLLRKVLDHIDAHPDEWQQNNWAQHASCGTAYCIAGHALVFTGHTLTIGQSGTVEVDDLGWQGIDGEATPGVVARAELGLTENEAYDLFNANNDRGRVQLLSERIAHRGGERL